MDIQATVRSPGDISRSQALDIQREIAAQLRTTVALKLLVVPVTLLDPLAPPTETPTVDVGTAVIPSPIASSTPTGP